MDQYLTAQEVAQRLRVHRETVLRWARARKLAGVKLARQWRFSETAVMQFIEQHER